MSRVESYYRYSKDTVYHINTGEIVYTGPNANIVTKTLNRAYKQGYEHGHTNGFNEFKSANEYWRKEHEKQFEELETIKGTLAECCHKLGWYIEE